MVIATPYAFGNTIVGVAVPARHHGRRALSDMTAGAFAGWGVVNQNINADWQVV